MDMFMGYLSASNVAIVVPSPEIRSTEDPDSVNISLTDLGKDCSPPTMVTFEASLASSTEKPTVG